MIVLHVLIAITYFYKTMIDNSSGINNNSHIGSLAELPLDLLDNDTIVQLIDSIEMTLNSRTHKRVHLGEEITVSGSLSKALKVPEIKKLLMRNNRNSHSRALAMLEELWPTLSVNTRSSALELAGFYNPKTLRWDDPRSNRKPLIKD